VFCETEQCLITPDSGTSFFTFPSWAYSEAKQYWFPKHTPCNPATLFEDFGTLSIT